MNTCSTTELEGNQKLSFYMVCSLIPVRRCTVQFSWIQLNVPWANPGKMIFRPQYSAPTGDNY